MGAMSKLNPAQTIIIPPGDVPWRVPDQGTASSVAEATLGGGEDQDGEYLVLMHYDGARADGSEPAVIAVSGTGPVRQQWVDPSRPSLRRW
jgi:hypothetical protein